MQRPKTKSIESPLPADQAYATLMSVVTQGKFTVLEPQHDARRLTFTSGKTALSWGQEYVAEIAPSGTGSKVTITSGSLDDAPKALLDGWKNGKAADKVLQAFAAANI